MWTWGNAIGEREIYSVDRPCIVPHLHVPLANMLFVLLVTKNLGRTSFEGEEAWQQRKFANDFQEEFQSHETQTKLKSINNLLFIIARIADVKLFHIKNVSKIILLFNLWMFLN